MADGHPAIALSVLIGKYAARLVDKKILTGEGTALRSDDEASVKPWVKEREGWGVFW
jgi:hypothetical protein